jgi:anaerobic sulfite reductase subunit B
VTPTETLDRRRDPLTPVPYGVVARRRQTGDVVTLELAAPAGAAPEFRTGQFNMLTAFGVGEVAISMSSPARPGATVEHTVRAVGAVTDALCEVPVGGVVGVRGPFGTDWGLDDLDESDVVVVAGGIGLAPLRGAVEALAVRRGGEGARRGGQVAVVLGARAPDQMVFADDLARWRDAGVHVETTVDTAGPAWEGNVGVVTALLPGLPFDPARAVAMVCGPEIMMRFTIRALQDRGMPLERIRVSLERNMQCGVGWCGHCQLGPLLICRDGPVFTCSPELLALLGQRER